MELTPLRRASSGAVLGGVCAGLARRWRVDPTIVRIGMVLLALIGALGVAFYVGALLLIPRDDSTEFPLYRVAPFTRSWSPAAAIGAVVGLGIVITLVVGPWLPFGLAPVVGLGFLWYFGFYRRRQAAAQAPERTDLEQSDFERAAAEWRDRVAEEQARQQNPPVAPAATRPEIPAHQPEIPAYQPPPAVQEWTPPAGRGRRRGPAWLWPLVLCLTGAGLAGLAVWSGVAGVHVPGSAYAATVLGALGLGLLISAFTGRARGMLPLSILAGLTTLVMMIPVPQLGRFGTETYRYTSMAQLPAAAQRHAVGDVTVDLTDLSITETRQIEFTSNAGDLVVRLPASGNVVVRWTVGVGDVTGPDGRAQDGVNLTGSHERIVDPSAPVLTVVVGANVGSLRVTQ